MRNVKTKRMVESAILLAVAFILSMIKITINPNGGSITLASMLPLVILGYRHGPAWGMLCGAVHGLLQMIEGGLYAPPVQNFMNYVLVILLDYIVAWAMVGLLAGMVGKVVKNPRTALTVGAAVGILGRYICSFISGVIIWGVYAPEGQSAMIYSAIVNGTLFLTEGGATTIIAFLVMSFSIVRNLITTGSLRDLKAQTTAEV